MAAILISAFPGLGKTYLYYQYRDRLKILDLNTRRFEGDDFPGNYIAEVEKRLNDYDLILLSSDRNVRYALNDAGLDFDLFYPSKDRKNELIEIYVTNRKSRNFIMNLDHNFYDLIDEIEDEDLEHSFKHKLDKPHRFIAQYDLLNNFLNSTAEMNGNKPVEKSSIEGKQEIENANTEKNEFPEVDENELPQVSDEEAKRSFEDFQLRNITSLINKCNIGDDNDVPSEFKDITITSSEYNALLYVRARLKTLKES